MRSIDVLKGLEGSFSGDLFFDGISSELISLSVSAVPGDTEGDNVEQKQTQDQSSGIGEG